MAARSLYDEFLGIEGELRAAAARAAELGKWEYVRAASEAARSLSAARGDVIPSSSSEPSPTVAHKSPAAGPLNRPLGHGRRRSSKATGAYPKFTFKDGDLVKTGWSRREQSEYEHRASADTVRAVALAIESMQASNRSVPVDRLLPIIRRDGTEIPSYQCYLILRWMQDFNLIQKISRGEYVQSSSRNLIEDAEQALIDASSAAALE